MIHCPDCHFENPVATTQCMACNHPLPSTCLHCGTVMTPVVRFCSMCGVPHSRAETLSIDQSLTPPSLSPPSLSSTQIDLVSQRKAGTQVLTILFVDLCGSSRSMTSLHPEAAAQFMNQTFQIMQTPILSHGGIINRFIGDEILAFFGLSQVLEEAPEHAIRAALEIREVIQQAGQNIRASINSGEVYIGPVGTEQHEEYTAIGTAINVAAHLKHWAQPGQILIGAETYQRTRNTFAFMSHVLAGKTSAQPVTTYEVLSPALDPAQRRAIDDRTTPFIGWNHEMAVMQTCLATLARGRGQIVSLIGKAGYGKSRMIQELHLAGSDAELRFKVPGDASTMRDTGVWLEGTCTTHSWRTPYGALTDMLERYLDQWIETADRLWSARLRSVLRALVSQGHLGETRHEELTALLGGFLDVQDTRALSSFLASDARPAQIESAFCDFFLALSREQPRILVFEDMHHVDSGTLNVLALLMTRLSQTPLLILYVYQPDRCPEITRFEMMTKRDYPDCSIHMRVRPLTLRQSHELMETLCNALNLPPAIFTIGIHQARGNPRMLEEFLRSLHRDATGQFYERHPHTVHLRHLDISGTITTIAGSGPFNVESNMFAGDGVKATEAVIMTPAHVFVNEPGDVFLINRYRIRKVNPFGIITTIAGKGTQGYGGDGGPATEASMNTSHGVWGDHLGNLYIADTHNHRVRVVDARGIMTTIAGTGSQGFGGDGGPAESAHLNTPCGISEDGMGNLYIADTLNHRIRQVNRHGVMTTIAGNGTPGFAGDGGPAATAALHFPKNVYVNAVGQLYIADTYNHRIRKIDADGIITTVVGSGPDGYDHGAFGGDGGSATSSRLDKPTDLSLADTGELYVVDSCNHRIRKVDVHGMIETVCGSGIVGEHNGSYAGDGGSATSARLNQPSSIHQDGHGNLYISDMHNHCIRKIDDRGIISTYAGLGSSGGDSGGFAGDGGPATEARLYELNGVCKDTHGNLYISDTTNHRVRMVSPAGIITTIAGTDTYGYSGDGGPGDGATLKMPESICLDNDANLYIADFGNSCIRKLDTRGNITTIAGTGVYGFSGDGGPATAARLGNPAGVFVDAVGILYIADYENHRLRTVDRTGRITTIAGTGTPGFSGDGGPAITACLHTPYGVFVDSARNIFVTSYLDHRIRKIDPDGLITTFAGTGIRGYSGDGDLATKANLNMPIGVFGDSVGNIYITDRNNQRIRQVDQSGIITTLVGTGTLGFSGDGGSALSATLNAPRCGFVDAAGTLYIADTLNHRVRQVAPISAPPDTLHAAETFSWPGGQAFVDVSLQTTHAVSSLQFTIQPVCHGLPTTLASFNALVNDLDDQHVLTEASSDGDGGTHLHLLSTTQEGLPPGWHTLVRLVYNIDSAAPVGTQIHLILQDGRMSDPEHHDLPCLLQQGTIHIRAKP